MPRSESKLKLAEIKLISENAESLSRAGVNRLACEECGLGKAQNSYLPPDIPTGYTGRFLIVGEHPTSSGPRNEALKPLSSLSGEVLMSILRQARVPRRDVAFVWAIRCGIPQKKKPTMKSIRACRPFLLKVIETANPRFIVTLGSNALKAVTNDGRMTNITEHRGRAITVPGIKATIYATYNPASVLHGNLHHRDRLYEDIHRTTWEKLIWPIDRPIDKEPSEVMGFDTEFLEIGSGDPPVADRQVLTVALADHFNAHSYQPDDPRLVALFRNIKKLAPHNGPCDIDTLVQLFLAKESWVQGKDIWDSLWLSRLADENRGKGGYKLENLLTSLYNVEGWKHKTEVLGYDPRKWPPPLRDERCRLDAWASLVLATFFVEKARGKRVLQHRIGMTLQRILHTGCYIDQQFLKKLEVDNAQELASTKAYLEKRSVELGMETCEPGNKNWVRDLLFDKLEIEPPGYTPSGLPTAGKVLLNQLKEEYPEVAAVLKYSKYDKIRQVYLEGVKELLIPGSDLSVNGKELLWMPIRINPLGARTLRRSSGKDPFDSQTEETSVNFQNWTKAVRPLITSRYNNGVIVDNDYHKLEAILQGWLAKEEKMVDYFLNTPNGYIKIGSDLFGKTVEPDTSDYTLTKSIVLGVNYNMKVWSLAKNLLIRANIELGDTWETHLEETERIHARYMRMFPNLKRYIRRCGDEALRTGKVKMLLGYERRLPIPPEPPKSEKEAHKIWRKYVGHVENEAANCKAQHLASLITGSAMLDVEERLLHQYDLYYTTYHKLLMDKDWDELNMPLLLVEVHDDLVYDMPKKNRKRDLRIIKETMEELPTLRKMLPELGDIIRVDQEVCSSWGLKS